MTAATYAEMIYELGGFLAFVAILALAMVASTLAERIHVRLKRRKKS